MCEPDLPTGTVTFLFTDIEGSTKPLQELGAEAYGATLAEHRRLLREAFATHSGVEVNTQGDAFFVAFAGADVHLGARIAASGHGGQVLLSRDTRMLLDEAFELLDLGEHRVKDFAAPVRIFQLGGERFPPLKTISNTNLPRLPSSSSAGSGRSARSSRCYRTVLG